MRNAAITDLSYGVSKSWGTGALGCIMYVGVNDGGSAYAVFRKFGAGAQYTCELSTVVKVKTRFSMSYTLHRHSRVWNWLPLLLETRRKISAPRYYRTRRMRRWLFTSNLRWVSWIQIAYSGFERLASGGNVLVVIHESPIYEDWINGWILHPKGNESVLIYLIS